MNSEIRESLEHCDTSPQLEAARLPKHDENNHSGNSNRNSHHDDVAHDGAFDGREHDNDGMLQLDGIQLSKHDENNGSNDNDDFPHEEIIYDTSPETADSNSDRHSTLSLESLKNSLPNIDHYYSSLDERGSPGKENISPIQEYKNKKAVHVTSTATEVTAIEGSDSNNSYKGWQNYDWAKFNKEDERVLSSRDTTNVSESEIDDLDDGQRESRSIEGNIEMEESLHENESECENGQEYQTEHLAINGITSDTRSDVIQDTNEGGFPRDIAEAPSQVERSPGMSPTNGQISPNFLDLKKGFRFSTQTHSKRDFTDTFDEFEIGSVRKVDGLLNYGLHPKESVEAIGARKETETIQELQSEVFSLKIKINVMEEHWSQNSEAGVTELRKQLIESQSAQRELISENNNLREKLTSLSQRAIDSSIAADMTIDHDGVVEKGLYDEILDQNQQFENDNILLGKENRQLEQENQHILEEYGRLKRHLVEIEQELGRYDDIRVSYMDLENQYADLEQQFKELESCLKGQTIDQFIKRLKDENTSIREAFNSNRQVHLQNTNSNINNEYPTDEAATAIEEAEEAASVAGALLNYTFRELMGLVSLLDERNADYLPPEDGYAAINDLLGMIEEFIDKLLDESRHFKNSYEDSDIQLSSTQRELVDVRREAESLLSSNKQLREKQKRYEQSQDHMIRETRDLQNKLDSVIRIVKTQYNPDATADNVVRYMQNAFAVVSEIQIMSDQVNELSDNLTTRDKQVDESKKQIAILETDLNSAKKQIAKLEMEATQRMTEITKFESDRNVLERQLKALTHERDILETRLDNQDDSVSSAQELAVTRSNLTQTQAELNNLRKQLNATKIQLVEVEQKVTELTAEHDEDQSQLTQLTAENVRLSVENQDAKAKIERAHLQIEQWKKDAAEYKRQVAMHASKCQLIEAKLADLSEKKNSNMNDVIVLERELNKYIKERKRAAEELTMLGNQLDQTEQAIKRVISVIARKIEPFIGPDRADMLGRQIFAAAGSNSNALRLERLVSQMMDTVASSLSKSLSRLDAANGAIAEVGLKGHESEVWHARYVEMERRFFTEREKRKIERDSYTTRLQQLERESLNGQVRTG